MIILQKGETLSSRRDLRKVDLRTARLESLNNPLSIGLAKGGGRVGESVRDTLASGDVGQGSNTLSLRAGIDDHLDLVTNADAEAAEAVRNIRDPLVPSIKGTISVEGNTSLKNGSLAGITVDTNPSGGSGVGSTGDLRNLDGTLDLGVSSANLNGARPVGGLLSSLGSVGHGVDSAVGGGGGEATASTSHGVTAGSNSTLDKRLARGSGSNASEESESYRGLHDESSGFE